MGDKGKQSEIILYNRPSEARLVTGAHRRLAILPGDTLLEEQIREAHRQAADAKLTAEKRRLAQAQLEELVGKLAPISV